MENGSGPRTAATTSSTTLPPDPHLLIELEPWSRTFFRNLIDLLRPYEGARIDFSILDLSFSTGTFWKDVFVTTRLPWRGVLESALFHGIAIAILWALPRLVPPTIQPVPSRAFDSASVIYYSKDEYLPPLDTGARPTAPTVAQKGDPEYARQPIISVPPEPDNLKQTIVTPLEVKLNHDVAIPNLVAWTPVNVPVPMAATSSASQVKTPALPVSVVAPAPELSATREREIPNLVSAAIAPAPQIENALARPIQAPKPAVVEPPPKVEATSTHKVGDINVGAMQVVAPAPQLALAEQRAIPEAIKTGFRAAAVPPPPLLAAQESSPVAGRLIALGIHPAALRGPIEPPSGNRRGKFAATPEGRPGAAATPEISPVLGDSALSNPNPTSGKAGPADLPPGLYVGPSQNPKASVAGPTGAASQNEKTQHIVDPRLLANATFPRVTPSRRSTVPVDDIHASDAEKQVFGPRRFYSMTLNMPNLNSIGGSWVIRFAELKEDGDKGDLVPPIATRKVDPAYPAELMRTRVEGTITLYAVIHSDGSVGDVRVLQGNDDRLNGFACSALARWHFRPATKNGNAVALEAVVTIPFRAAERQ